jgi:hypothetical protein
MIEEDAASPGCDLGCRGLFLCRYGGKMTKVMYFEDQLISMRDRS